MMYEAVTGTASPSTQTARAEQITLRKSPPPATSTIMPDSLSPSPVSVTTETIIPAAGTSRQRPAAAAGARRAAPSPIGDRTWRHPVRGAVVEELEKREHGRVEDGEGTATARGAIRITIANSDEKW